jgi:small subunit ribosomal protein S21
LKWDKVAANGPPPHVPWGTGDNVHCPSVGRPKRIGVDKRAARSISGDFEGSSTAFMQIIVRDNNVDQALRALKKKLQREGVYREMKLRRHYEKPSEKRARERAAAIRRARKLERKRVEREGGR